LEKCVGSRVHLVGVSISFEKNFYRLPFTPPSLVRRIGPSKTRITDQLTHLKHMHDTTATLVAPTVRQGGIAGRPSSEVRLARGLDAPSGEFRLSRGLNAPSGGVRLARGLNPTLRPRSASLEGSTPPRRGPSRSRVPACTLPTLFPCVRAFNALTPQDARRDLGTPGNRVPALFHQLSGGGHPLRCSSVR
jgi:hypothetical protein